MQFRTTPDASKRVTVIPGDGIGPEVVGAARRVVEATGVRVAWEDCKAGTAVFRRVLLVTCVESQVVERLRAAFPASALLRNLGGLVPRSTRAARAAADVEVIESALDHAGVRHVVCVGHLGCHATRATTRYASSAHGSGGPRDRDVRAIEHHVFMQMHHARAYLRRRAQHPVVRVSGIWVDETSGHVLAFDPASRAFAPLGDFDLTRYSVTVPARTALRPPQT